MNSFSFAREGDATSVSYTAKSNRRMFCPRPHVTSRRQSGASRQVRQIGERQVESPSVPNIPAVDPFRLQHTPTLNELIEFGRANTDIRGGVLTRHATRWVEKTGMLNSIDEPAVSDVPNCAKAALRLDSYASVSPVKSSRWLFALFCRRRFNFDWRPISFWGSAPPCHKLDDIFAPYPQKPTDSEASQLATRNYVSDMLLGAHPELRQHRRGHDGPNQSELNSDVHGLDWIVLHARSLLSRPRVALDGLQASNFPGEGNARNSRKIHGGLIGGSRSIIAA